MYIVWKQALCKTCQVKINLIEFFDLIIASIQLLTHLFNLMNQTQIYNLTKTSRQKIISIINNKLNKLKS